MTGEENSRKDTGERQQDAEKKEFSREQLLASGRFRDRRDLLNALLSPEKTYTVSDVEQAISKYMKGRVK